MSNDLTLFADRSRLTRAKPTPVGKVVSWLPLILRCVKPCSNCERITLAKGIQTQ